jgi:RNA exonuclease 4
MAAPERKAYIGLDCEMVGLAGGRSALAQVTLVDDAGRVIYSAYVRPPVGARIADYRTEFSGITPEILHNPRNPSFARVQSDVAALIRGKIVVGHALENDFRALRLTHPPEDVRNTTKIPIYMRVGPSGRLQPRKLKDLALEFLGREIQTRGHDAGEDAAAAMALFRRTRRQRRARRGLTSKSSSLRVKIL